MTASDGDVWWEEEDWPDSADSLTLLLKDPSLQDLGPVDENWFDHLTYQQQLEGCRSKVKCPASPETNVLPPVLENESETIPLDASSLDMPQLSPVRHLGRENEQGESADTDDNVSKCLIMNGVSRSDQSGTNPTVDKLRHEEEREIILPQMQDVKSEILGSSSPLQCNGEIRGTSPSSLFIDASPILPLTDSNLPPRRFRPLFKTKSFPFVKSCSPLVRNAYTCDLDIQAEKMPASANDRMLSDTRLNMQMDSQQGQYQNMNHERTQVQNTSADNIRSHEPRPNSRKKTINFEMSSDQFIRDNRLEELYDAGVSPLHSRADQFLGAGECEEDLVPAATSNLFSPDPPQGSRCAIPSSLNVSGLDVSPGTPGMPAMTPAYLAQGHTTVKSNTLSPLPSWLKSQPSTSRRGRPSLAQKLATSLGAHLNESGMSWTSSLATPVGEQLTTSEVDVAVKEEREEKAMGAARQLFSPGELHSSQEVEEFDAGLRLNTTLDEDTLEEASKDDTVDILVEQGHNKLDTSDCKKEKFRVSGRMPRIRGLRRLDSEPDGVKMSSLPTETKSEPVSPFMNAGRCQKQEMQRLYSSWPQDKQGVQLNIERLNCSLPGNISHSISNRESDNISCHLHTVGIAMERSEMASGKCIPAKDICTKWDDAFIQDCDGRRDSKQNMVDCGNLRVTVSDLKQCVDGLTHTLSEKPPMSQVSSENIIQNPNTDIDDVLSLFSTPPSRSGLRKRFAPQKTRRKLVRRNYSDGDSEFDISQGKSEVMRANEDKTCDDMQEDAGDHPGMTRLDVLPCRGKGGGKVDVDSPSTKSAQMCTSQVESESDGRIDFHKEVDKTPSVASRNTKMLGLTGNLMSPLSPDDMSFTQISPSSLSVMVEAADRMESQPDTPDPEVFIKWPVNDATSCSLNGSVNATKEDKSPNPALLGLQVMDSSPGHTNSLSQTSQLMGNMDDINTSSNIPPAQSLHSSNSLPLQPPEAQSLHSDKGSLLLPTAAQSLHSPFQPVAAQAIQSSKELPLLPTATQSLHSPFQPVAVQAIQSSKESPLLPALAQSIHSSQVSIQSQATQSRHFHDSSSLLPTLKHNQVEAKLNNPQPKRLSLGRKPKKFAYPSKRQINDTCPRRVFNFEACSDTGSNDSDKEMTNTRQNQVTDVTLGTNMPPTDVQPPSKKMKMANDLNKKTLPEPHINSCMNERTLSNACVSSKHYHDNAVISDNVHESSMLSQIAAEFATDWHPDDTADSGSRNSSKGVENHFDKSTLLNTTGYYCDGKPDKNINNRPNKSALPVYKPGDSVPLTGITNNAAHHGSLRDIGRTNVSCFQAGSEVAPCISMDSDNVSGTTSNREFQITYRRHDESGMSDVKSSPETHSLGGFSSASGKSIMVSLAAQHKARGLIAQVETEFLKETVNSVTKRDLEGPSNQSVEMISYANSRTPEATCAKPHELSEAIPNRTETGISASDSQALFVPSSSGFSAASGKAIRVSAAAEARAKRLFIDLEEEQMETKQNIQTAGADCKLTSASGKSMNVTTAAQGKARKLMTEIENETDDILQPEVSKTPNFCGFTSASGKGIPVSGTALQQARRMMDEIEEDSPAQKYKPERDAAECSGFSSASGKHIQVSAAAQLKAKQLMTDLDIDDTNHALDDRSKPELCDVSTEFSGFCAASGKNMSISSLSKQKAVALMVDVERDVDSEGDCKNAKVDLPQRTGSSGKQDKVGSSHEKKSKPVSRHKGFLPFKPVRPSHGKGDQVKKVESSESERRSTTPAKTIQITPIHSPLKDLSNLKGDTGAIIKNSTCLPGGDTVTYGILADEEDVSEDNPEDLTCTQMVEVSHGTAAFLENEYDFTQTQYSPHGDKIKALTKLRSNSPLVSSTDSTKINNDKDYNDEDNILQPHQRAGDLGGFLTGSGAKINISAKALTYAMKFMESTDEEKEIHSNDSVTGSKALCARSKLDIRKHPDDGGDAVGKSNQMKRKREIHSEAEEETLIRNTDDKENLELDVKDEHTVKNVPSKIINTTAVSGNIMGPGGDAGCFRGFQTAGGTLVKTSAKALNQAKRLLANLEESTIENSDIQSPSVNISQQQTLSTDSSFPEAPSEASDSSHTTFQGFKTGHGKDVAVSKESLKRAQSLLSDVDGEDMAKSRPSPQPGSLNMARVLGRENEHRIAKPTEENVTSSTHTSSATSHRTTSDGTKINFHGSDEKHGGFPGFQTCLGKDVTVDKRSLEKDHSIFSELEQSDPPMAHSATDDGIENHNLRDQLPEPNHTSFNKAGKSRVTQPGFAGFETGNGLRIQVSSEAIEKAKSLLLGSVGDDEETKSNGKHVAPRSPDRQFSDTATVQEVQTDFTTHKSQGKKEPQEIRGFKSGSGKTITVSEKSIKDAQKLISSVEDIHDTSNPNLDQVSSKVTSLNDSMSGSRGGFQGFTTGSGKAVVVNQEAMNKARGLMKDVENMFQAESPITQKSTFVGFQTGSGREVHVSKEAYQGAQRLIKGDTDSPTKPSPESQKFAGFSTGSGKTVTVSEKAMNLAKGLLNFEEKPQTGLVKPETQGLPRSNVKLAGEAWSVAKGDVSSEENVSTVKENSSFGGFQTCSGKAVTVSKKSLEAAQHLMDDVVNDVKTEERSPSTSFGGFQTGHGSNVKVSDAAMLAAKSLIASDTNKSDLTEKQDGSHESGHHKFSAAAKLGQKPIFMKKPAVSCISGKLSGVKGDSGPSARVHMPFHKVTKPSGGLYATASSSGRVYGGGQPQVDEAQEASESVRALMSDDLEDMWLQETGVGPDDRQMCTGARKQNPGKPWPSSATGQQRYSLHSPLGKPVLSSPEIVREDRDQSSRHIMPHVLKSAPPEDIRLLHKYQKKASAANAIATVPVAASAEPCIESSFKTPYRKTGAAAPPSTPIASTKAAPSTTRTPDSGDFDGISDSQLLASEVTTQDFEEQCEPGKLAVHPRVLKARLKARVAQAQATKQKKVQGGVKPAAGSLYELKRQNPRKWQLRQAVGGQRPGTYTPSQLYKCGVQSSTLSVTAATAEDFRFNVQAYFGVSVATSAIHLTVGDCGQLVLDEDSTVGKQEFCNALFALESLDPKLVSREWVYNHYRWIVWKLAAMEVAFPHMFGARCLTPDRVLLQLKYRYDREVDHSQRSCLKKIHERDDTSVKPMVLCVCGILQLPGHHGNQTPIKQEAEGAAPTVAVSHGVVELTDGWYSIKAALGPALTRLALQGRITVGTKLCMYGAELMGPQDATPPLEIWIPAVQSFISSTNMPMSVIDEAASNANCICQAAADTCLKLCANSVRRACWDARLGFCRQPQPPALPLSSLLPNGGQVSCVDVLVARVYPMQYMEKQGTGSAVFRNSRGENRAAQKYETSRQRNMENLYRKIQTQLEKSSSGSTSTGNMKKRHWGSTELKCLQTGQEIYEALQQAFDPDDFQYQLSDHQRHLLRECQERVHSDRQAEMQLEFNRQLAEAQDEVPSRVVVPLIKIKLVGCHTADIDQKKDVLLTVWRPTDDLLSLLREGERFHMYNISAGEARGRNAQGVSLTVGRSTRYQQVALDDNLKDLVYQPREVVSFHELISGESHFCGEVDLVGVVVYMASADGHQTVSDGRQLQVVYIANQEEEICAVKFWGGLESHVLEDIVKMKSILALSNLQLRQIPGSVFPTCHANDFSHITANPKEKHLNTALTKLKAAIKDLSSFVGYMQTKVLTLLAAARSQPRVCTPNKTRPSTPHHTVEVVSRHNISAASIQDSGYSSIRMTPSKQTPSCSTSHGKTTPRSLQTPTKSYVHSSSPPMDFDEDMDDPVLSQKKMLQQHKAERLACYGSPPKVTPLYTKVSRTVQKAFKAPRRSLPADLSGTPVNTKTKIPKRLSIGSYGAGATGKREVATEVCATKGGNELPHVNAKLHDKVDQVNSQEKTSTLHDNTSQNCGVMCSEEHSKSNLKQSNEVPNRQLNTDNLLSLHKHCEPDLTDDNNEPSCSQDSVSTMSRLAGNRGSRLSRKKPASPDTLKEGTEDIPVDLLQRQDLGHGGNDHIQDKDTEGSQADKKKSGRRKRKSQPPDDTDNPPPSKRRTSTRHK